MSDPLEPKRGPGDDKGKPSTTRIAIWIGVAAVALYFIGSGVVGILTNGN